VTEEMTTVLLVGATGSIGNREHRKAGRRRGARRRVRNQGAGEQRHSGGHVSRRHGVVVGDLTKAETLRPAVPGVTGIIFTPTGSFAGWTVKQIMSQGAARPHKVGTQLGRKIGESSVTTAELGQSRQNSLPSGSVITMKPALIGGAGS
jgi:hypothetical protein